MQSYLIRFGHETTLAGYYAEIQAVTYIHAKSEAYRQYGFRWASIILADTREGDKIRQTLTKVPLGILPR